MTGLSFPLTPVVNENSVRFGNFWMMKIFFFPLYCTDPGSMELMDFSPCHCERILCQKDLGEYKVFSVLVVWV